MTTERRVSRSVMNEALRKAIKSAGPRFTPGLRDYKNFPNLTIKSLTTALSGLARSKQFWDQLTSLMQKIRAGGIQSRERERLQEFFPQLRSKVAYANKSLKVLAATISTDLLSATHGTGAIEFKRCRRRLLGLQKTLESSTGVPVAVGKWGGGKALKRDERTKDDIRSLSSQIYGLQGRLRDALEFWDSAACELANQPLALLLGRAGTGKTHFVCDLATVRLRNRQPTVIVLAQTLNPREPDLLKAIIASLRLTTSKSAFMKSLSGGSVEAGERALVIIDGVNEGSRNQWRNGLGLLIDEFAKYPGIGLIVTCRTPFEQLYILRRFRGRFVTLFHPGFQGIEIDAHTAFFEFYAIAPPKVALLSSEFSNPLFLKIICEALRNIVVEQRHRQLKEIAEGQKGFTELFEKYIKHKEDALSARIAAWAPRSLVRPEQWLWHKGRTFPGVIKEAAELMAERSDCHLRPKDVDGLICRYITDRRFAARIRRLLVSEGVFLSGIIWAGNRPVEVLQFPYQRISDHLIVRAALSKIDASDEKAVLGLIERLCDIPNLIEALMLELPIRTHGKEYFQFLGKRQIERETILGFVEGLPWRPPDSFTALTRRYVENCIEWEESRRAAFDSVCTMALRPGHPCGAAFLDSYLSEMRMADRDLACVGVLALRGWEFNTSSYTKLV